MRVVTKYTYLYRIIGIVGCVLVLGSLFIPWVTVNTGQLQDFEEGSSPTGWELSHLELGGAWDENIFAYLFMIINIFLILPFIGIVLILIGKDARSIGYYLVSMSAFFLILILFMMPVIQESIPIPDNPYDSMSQEEIDLLDASRKAQLDEQLEHRDRIINMKRISIGPNIGVVLTVVGGVVTYIGSRLVIRDAERINDMYKYYILLQEAHKSGSISKEEEDLLAAQRRMFKISRDEHEMLLRKMFPDEKDFKNAVYMHDNPIDRDRILIEKALQDYEVFLRQAYGHGGDPTKEEFEMLEIIRRTLNISMEDHYMILDYLRAEGMIKVKRKGPPKRKKVEALAEVPDEVVAPEDGCIPRYVHSWEYKSTITREDPLPPPTPEVKRTPSKKEEGLPKIGEPKMAAPKVKEEKEPSQRPSREKASPGPPKPDEKVASPEKKVEKEPPGPTKKMEETPKKAPKRPSKVKCTKCGTTIPVPPSDGPVKIKCPKCGATGRI